MRSAMLLRLLLVPPALLGTACDDTSLPGEPAPEQASVETPASATADRGAALTTVPHWADGYLHAGSPTTASYSPIAYLSYNRAGGTMTTEAVTVEPQAGGDSPVLLGKRYTDDESGVEVLCTKPGAGPLVFAGRELEVKSATALPASD